MLEDKAIINRIKNILLASKRLLLICHQNPDGDALGAVSAMAQFFKAQKKDYAIYCKDLPSKEYFFIPLIYEITSDTAIFNQRYDVILVLDSGDLKYAGIEEYVGKNKGYILINIDHHFTNEFFGDLNLVSKDSSSVCELLAGIFKIWGVRINKEIATALLAGLIFDTGNMSNHATSEFSLRTAASLLSSGARSREIINNLLKNKTLNMLKLWGRAMERLKINMKNNFAIAAITAIDMQEFQINPEASLGLINFFNELSDAHVSLLLVELPDGTIKGSLRTTREDIDVSALAKKLGGGGHRKAAGFTINGRLVYNDGRWMIK